MEQYIVNSEVLFSQMRKEFSELREEYPFLTGFEVAEHVLHDVHLFAHVGVASEYSAKQLFRFWVRNQL